MVFTNKHANIQANIQVEQIKILIKDKCNLASNKSIAQVIMYCLQTIKQFHISGQAGSCRQVI